MMKNLRQLLPSWFKGRAKESMMGLMGLPWSRFGVPGPLISSLGGKSGLTLIDIGASKGLFTSSLDQYCGVSRALLVEPQPKHCEHLRQKFLQRYSVVCAAMADREGFIDMEILNWDYSSSILPARRDRPEVNALFDLGVREVVRSRLTTLDNLCVENAFNTPIDLLKIDVQGAEHLVLAGARDTLRRTEILWTEVSFQPLYDGSSTIEDIIATCREQGFQLQHLQEGFRASNGELLQADALFVKMKTDSAGLPT
jgi:FkbM family methyltransferase